MIMIQITFILVLMVVAAIVLIFICLALLSENIILLIIRLQVNNNLGLEVNFRLNIVTGITIYPYGNIKFDWSGLSAKSSSSDFEYKYNASMTGRGNIDIGHGELICINKIRFGNNGVYLGIFTPGYVF